MFDERMPREWKEHTSKVKFEGHSFEDCFVIVLISRESKRDYKGILQAVSTRHL